MNNIEQAARLWLPVLALVVLNACSTPERFKGVAVGKDATLITAVPPLLQTKQVSCGPTCVAAVAAYWGIDFSPSLTNSPVLLSDDSTVSDLKRFADSLGIQALSYQGSFADLETNIQSGRPLIALIPRALYEQSPQFLINGIPLTAIWEIVAPQRSHWIIVIGYTDSKIILQDPGAGRMAISRSKFEAWWKSKRFTCLLLSPTA